MAPTKTFLVLAAMTCGANAVTPQAAACPSKDAFPWCDYTMSPSDRAKAVVANLTVDEKAGLFINTASSVPRINWPAYNWWSEALHGVARDGVATSFPQICGVGASGNRTLWNAIADVTSTEGRGMNNNVGGGMYHGLSFWAPNVNIFRDPRWGRGEETPGEDPMINGEYAKEFVTGMQGDQKSGYLKVSSCLKHYAAYSEETGRTGFPAMVTSQDMEDTYLPAFEAGVTEGNASSMMCSYNAESYGEGIFGAGTQGGAIPSCANKGILDDLARDKWGFEGYITSDCGAVTGVENLHHYTNNTDDTIEATLAAGMDTDCGGFMKAAAMTTAYGVPRLAALADRALRNLFTVQFRLGFGTPDTVVPFAQLGQEVVNTPAHQALALSAAQQSLVLLKNEGADKLPWTAKPGMKVAVIGREANATTNMQGNYFGTAPFLVSPIEGISKMVTTVTCDMSDLNACDSVIASADAVVMVMGLNSEGAHPSDEAEGHDRTSLLYPGMQNDFINHVAATAKKPIAVVTMGGGPVDVTLVKNNSNIGSLMWCGYPGQSGGTAIADAIFGKTNTFGKLTLTWYPEEFTNQVTIFDMGMRPNKTSGNPGRSYRFYTGTPVYAFGSGLSFTSFDTKMVASTVPAVFSTVVSEYTMLKKDTTHVATISTTVTNTGDREGDQVVQIFASPPNAGVNGAPLQNLIAFDRIHLEKGESTTLKFEIKSHQFTFADRQGYRTTQQGDWKIWAGLDKSTVVQVTL